MKLISLADYTREKLDADKIPVESEMDGSETNVSVTNKPLSKLQRKDFLWLI